MFRRSSSASQIPVSSGTNLFNVGRARSRSSTRNSGSTVTSAQKSKRRSSSESKLSINRLSRQTHYQQSKMTPRNQQGLGRSSNVTTPTPQNQLGFGRSSSQSKITPSTQRSAGSSRAGSAVLRERKTIQKLSTDKQWVSQQHAKVMSFIESSELFDPEIANPSHLKSLTIKSFVYISSVLLEQIFPTVKITLENYKEEITAKLKVLRYPGTLPISVLKMVYTPHVWPQIIGYFGWLVDKINLKNYSDNLSLSTLEPEIRQKYLVTQSCKDYLIQRYRYFNSQDDTEERQLSLNEQYKKDLKEILQVDSEQYTMLEKEVLKHSEYVVKQKNDITVLQSRIEKIQTEIDNINKEIDECEEVNVIQETTLSGELKYLQDRLKKIRITKNSLKNNIEKLQETIKNQPCTYKEKMHLWKKYNEMKHEIDIKKEKIEQSQKIRQEFEDKLNTDRSKLEQACISWNRSLQKWIIAKPQLKRLLLRETGFHQESFLAEIKEVIKQINVIDKELVEESEIIQNKIKNEQTKKCQLEEQMEILNKIINAVDEEYAKLEARNLVTEENIKTLRADFAASLQAYEQKIQTQENVFKNQQIKIEEGKKECEQLDNEVKKFITKSLSFLIEYRNKILICKAESEERVINLEKRVLEQIIEKQNKILDSLDKN